MMAREAGVHQGTAVWRPGAEVQGTKVPGLSRDEVVLGTKWRRRDGENVGGISGDVGRTKRRRGGGKARRSG